MDIAKNIMYYKQHSIVCSCMQNEAYTNNIEQQYTQLTKYLQTFGIDVKQPFAMQGVEEKDTYVAFQEVQYIVLGKIHKEFHKRIGPVDVHVAKSHIETGIQETFSVLELGPIRIQK